jgi:hypothetical protein
MNPPGSIRASLRAVGSTKPEARVTFCALAKCFFFLLVVLWSVVLWSAPQAHAQYQPPPATGGGVTDGQQLFDGSHILSLDAGARKLYGTDGAFVAVDYSQVSTIALGNLAGGPGVSYVAVDYDGTGFAEAELVAGIATFGVIDNNGVKRAVFNGFDQIQLDHLENHTADSLPNIDLFSRKLYNPDGTTVAIDYGSNGAVKLPNLPTSDPAVANQLWNDAGTLKISAGP